MPGLSLSDPLRDPSSPQGGILRTKRLQLKPADYPDWVEAKATRTKPEGYVDHPVPERDAQADRVWWAEGVEAGRCWMWGIWLPDGTLIGLLSAFGFSASGEAEIGIEVLHPRWMRKGYGREALEAWSQHLSRYGRERQLAWVHPGNAPSLRLFASAGFSAIGEVQDHTEPDWTFCVFRKGPQDWLNAPL